MEQGQLVKVSIVVYTIVSVCFYDSYFADSYYRS